MTRDRFETLRKRLGIVGTVLNIASIYVTFTMMPEASIHTKVIIAAIPLLIWSTVVGGVLYKKRQATFGREMNELNS